MLNKKLGMKRATIFHVIALISLLHSVSLRTFSSKTTSKDFQIPTTEIVSISANALVSDKVFYVAHYKKEGSQSDYVVEIRDENGEILFLKQVSSRLHLAPKLESSGIIVLANEGQYLVLKYRPSSRNFEALSEDLQLYPGVEMHAGFDGTPTVLCRAETHIFNFNLITGQVYAKYSLQKPDPAMVLVRGYYRVLRFDSINREIALHEVTSLDWQRSLPTTLNVKHMIADSREGLFSRYYFVTSPASGTYSILSVDVDDGITNIAMSNRFQGQIAWVADISNSPIVVAALSSPNSRYLLFKKDSIGYLESDIVDLNLAERILSTLSYSNFNLHYMSSHLIGESNSNYALSVSLVPFCNCQLSEIAPSLKCRQCDYCFPSTCIQQTKPSVISRGFDWEKMSLQACIGSWAGCTACDKQHRECTKCDSNSPYSQLDEYTGRCYNPSTNEIPSIHRQFD